MDSLHRKLVKRTRELMVRRGLSINKLADFSGLSRGRVSELMSGKNSPTLRTLGKLAEALGVQVRELLPED